MEAVKRKAYQGDDDDVKKGKKIDGFS